MAEIIIDGKPWFYEETSYIHTTTPTFNKEDAKILLTTIKKVFDSNGIKFILNYGTLLGAVREHDFISHDYDMDIDIWAKDREKLLRLIPELDKMGVKFTRHSGEWIYTFELNGGMAEIDIDIIYKARWPLNYRYNYSLCNYYPKFYVEETEKIIFLGEEYDIPKNPEKYLTYLFGKDWRIPKKGKPSRLQSKALIHINFVRFLKRVHSYIKRHYLS